MTDPNETPIVVNPDQTAAQAGVLIRYVLATLGGFLVAKGWISGDVLEAIINVALIVGPLAYAAYRSHQQKKAMVALAAAAPNGAIKGVDA